MMSYFVAKTLVTKLFPDKIEQLRKKIEEHQSNLFNYMLFLRLTPLVPNWFLNIASPIIGVPVQIFAIATFFGVMPQTFVAVKAGLTLQEMTSPNEVMNYKLILLLFGLGLASLLPTWEPFRNKLDKLLNTKVTKAE